MLRLLARRAAAFALVVLTSSVVFGALLWSAPGASDRIAQDSLLGWIGAFWVGVFTGDLGTSYRGLPVDEMLWRGALRSLPLIGAALVASLGSGLALALAFGQRIGRLGRLLRGALHAVSLCPVFLLGYLALVLVGIPPEGPRQTFFAVLILAVGDGMLSDVLLGIETELTRLRESDFIQSARLRGAPLLPHYAPHLALPLARLGAARLAWLVGGVLVLEMVFGIQGIGLIGYKAAAASPPDVSLLVAITVFVTALVAGAGLGVDLLRALIDPRVRKDRRAIERQEAA